VRELAPVEAHYRAKLEQNRIEEAIAGSLRRAQSFRDCSQTPLAHAYMHGHRRLAYMINHRARWPLGRGQVVGVMKHD
jgi:hypothetical protein